VDGRTGGGVEVVNLPALYVEAWVQPRQSMRRILSLNLSERDRLIMVAITGVLLAIPVTLIFRTLEMPPGPDGELIERPTALMTAFTTVAFMIAGYYVTAMVIKVLGTLFGGTASYADSKTASAWTQFVVCLANLALLFATFVLPAALEGVMRLLFTAATLFVSSAYVAEVHGFASIGKVIAVSVAVMLLMVLALMSFVPSGGLGVGQ